MSPRGRVLITGASRGIGRETALALAERGFDLLLWARNGSDLAEVAVVAGELGVSVETASVDVQDREQVAAAVGDVDALHGLVLNAGAGTWAPLSEIDVQEWERAIDTNLTGSFQVLQQVLPALRQGGNTLVVGVASDSAWFPFPQRAAYAASKSGMRALLEVARRELRASGHRISVVLPSRVDTHFQGSFHDAGPGSRPDALPAREVAGVVAGLFELSQHVEIREMHLAAMTSTYGPYPERVEQ